MANASVIRAASRRYTAAGRNLQSAIASGDRAERTKAIIRCVARYLDLVAAIGEPDGDGPALFAAMNRHPRPSHGVDIEGMAALAIERAA